MLRTSPPKRTEHDAADSYNLRFCDEGSTVGSDGTNPVTFSIKGDAPQGKCKFSVGDLVDVRCSQTIEGGIEDHVVRGIICKTIDGPGTVKHRDYRIALEIHGYTIDGEDAGIIRWSPTGGKDELPDFEFSRVRKLCPDFLALSSCDQRAMNVLRSHIIMDSVSSKEAGCNLDSAIDKELVSVNGIHESGIVYLLQKMAMKMEPNELIEKVTDGKKDSLLFLTYLLGRIAASEVGASVEASLSSSNLSSFGDQIVKVMLGGSACDSSDTLSALSELRNLGCPILVTFLVTAVLSTYYAKRKGFVKSHAFREDKARATNAKLEKVLTVISMIYGAKCSHSLDKQLCVPGVSAMRTSLRLMLDSNGGVRDTLMRELAKEGISWAPDKARDAITAAAAVIAKMTNPRENAAEAEVDVEGETIDNVDWRVFGGSVNNIVSGSVLVGRLKKPLWERLRDKFRPGFRQMHVGLARTVLPNEKTDEKVRAVVHGQNLQALLVAPRFLEGAKKVCSTNSRSAQDEHLVESFPEDGYVSGVEDGGGRHSVPRATTMHRFMVGGLSSKNSEVTKEVMEKLKEDVPGCMDNPRPGCFDQEIITTAYETFFIGLAASAAAGTAVVSFGAGYGLALFVMPLLLVVGYGHAAKNVAASMFSYHRHWLYDKCLAAAGYEPGSAKAGKLTRVQHIVKGLRSMLMINEALRIACAIQYFESVGTDKRIRTRGSSGKESPIEVLERYLQQTQRTPTLPKGHWIQTVLSPFKRIKAMVMTEDGVALSEDFWQYCRENENDDVGANMFGPGGSYLYEGDEYLCSQEAMTIPLDVDEEHACIFSEPYKVIVLRCKEAGIFTKSAGKSMMSLSNRLYAYLRAGGGDAGRAAAEKCTEEKRYERPPMPAKCNLSAKLVNGILFGAEGMGLLLCVLFCRERKSDLKCPHDSPSGTRGCWECKNQSRCLHHHDIVVMTQVLAMSIFQRNQPNYQKIMVLSLLYFGLVPEHYDGICVRIMMRLMRWTATLCRRCDSWLAECAEMLQEFSVVRPAKESNSKKPASTLFGNAKMLVKSLLTLRKEESEERSGQMRLGRKRPLTETEETNELAALNSLIECCRGIIRDALLAGTRVDPNEFVAGTRLPFRKVSDEYYRQFDAWQRFYETAASTALGFVSGLVVKHKYPYPTRKQMCPTDSKQRNNRRTPHGPGVALQHAESTGIVVVGPDQPEDLLFGPITKGGEGKSEMANALVSMVGNTSAEITAGSFGHSSIRSDSPNSRHIVNLFRDEEDASKWSKPPSGSATHVLVDGLKDIKVSQPGTTPRLLARGMIKRYISKYCKSGRIVYIFWDSEKYSTILRDMQRRIRGNEQVSDIQYIAAMTERNPDAPLERYGSYSFLMGKAKETYVPYQAEIIAHELMNCDNEAKWFPHKLLPSNCSLSFVGGDSMDKCCGFCSSTPGPCVNVQVSTGVTMSKDEVMSMMADSVKQGEGERMLANVADRIVQHAMGALCPPSSFDATIDFRIDDTDFLCGIAMPMVHRIRTKVEGQGSHFSGSIVIRAHNKTATGSPQLGQLLRSRDNSRVIGTPTGAHLLCYYDLIAMYSYFESDSELPQCDPGIRAMTLSALYTLYKTDYTFSSMDPSRMLSAWKCPQYIEACEYYKDTKNCHLVKLRGNELEYNAEGAWMWFQAYIMTGEKAERVLTRKYNSVRMKKSLSEFPIEYSVQQAVTVIGKEAHPAPSEIAFLCQISMAQVVLKDWAVRTYQREPDTGQATIDGSTYIRPRSNNENWTSEWSLALGRDELRAIHNATPLPDSVLEDIIHRHYGNIADSVLSCDSLKEAVRRACENEKYPGRPPAVNVALKDLIFECKAESVAEMKDKLEEAGTNYETRAEIYKHTICGCTTFKTKGKPLLTSNTPQQISTGTHLKNKGKRPIVDWKGAFDLSTEKVKDIFSLMIHCKEASVREKIDGLMQLLVAHVMDHGPPEDEPPSADEGREDSDDSDWEEESGYGSDSSEIDSEFCWEDSSDEEESTGEQDGEQSDSDDDELEESSDVCSPNLNEPSFCDLCCRFCISRHGSGLF